MEGVRLAHWVNRDLRKILRGLAALRAKVRGNDFSPDISDFHGAGAMARRKSEGGLVQEEGTQARGCILPFRLASRQPTQAGRLCYPVPECRL